MHNPQVSGKFNIVYSCYLFNRNSCMNVWCRLWFFSEGTFIIWILMAILINQSVTWVNNYHEQICDIKIAHINK